MNDSSSEQLNSILDSLVAARSERERWSIIRANPLLAQSQARTALEQMGSRYATREVDECLWTLDVAAVCYNNPGSCLITCAGVKNSGAGAGKAQWIAVDPIAGERVAESPIFGAFVKGNVIRSMDEYYSEQALESLKSQLSALGWEEWGRYDASSPTALVFTRMA